MIYQGSKTSQISFPLGGIGTGCIGLAGNGQLIDWEIFNRPSKGSENGFTHFAVKAESKRKLLDARVLVGDQHPPYAGAHMDRVGGFGFGVSRCALQGLPHFARHRFIGEFPFARIDFADRHFPGRVTLTAFNPFIPLNDADSSIPAAFFTIEIRNTTSRRLTYTVNAVLKNPHGEQTFSTYRRTGGIRTITLGTGALQPDDVAYGDLSVATDAETVSYQQYWYRGYGKFDSLEMYWRDLTQPGRLRNRVYSTPPKPWIQDHACLAAHIDVPPGQRGQVRFVIAWNWPNMSNYWNPPVPGRTRARDRWKNYYATLFDDSRHSATYSLRNWDRLYDQTLLFKKALFGSTVPPEVMDAVSANLSILKSPTVLRLEDGSLYGFEGCRCDSGCCEGSCTHVWNYAYALPFLFPRLERSMRDLDYRYNMRADGKMSFRLALPLGRQVDDYHAAADGQFGGVIKCYREWKISGDDEWLKLHWPAIKKAVEFAWAKTNEDRWDRDKDGVLEGRQHHTLDSDLFGPNTIRLIRTCSAPIRT